MMGEIIGGILLGPSLFGYLFPHAFGLVFSSATEIVLVRETFIKLGLLLFLFCSGAELNFSQLRVHKKSWAAISIAGFMIPFLLGVGGYYLWPNIWDVPPQTSAFKFSLFCGVALSISAIPVISKILLDLKLLQTLTGGLTLSVAAMHDVIGWAIFGFIVQDNQSQIHQNVWIVALFIVLLALALWSESWFQEQAAGEDSDTGITGSPVLIGPMIVGILAASFLMEQAGIHGVLGAFVLGIVWGRNPKLANARESLMKVAVNFFVPIYFVSIGLKTNFTEHFSPMLAAWVLFLACFGKISGALLGGKIGGMDSRQSLRIGYALNARGAMEIVIATIALDHGIISHTLFVALVFMAIATSLMSGPLIRSTFKRT